MDFNESVPGLIERVEQVLQSWLPAADQAPPDLHRAMRYAVFNGGKRIRPLLAYASAQALNLDPVHADGPAAAVELVHCYSLVHDDLPAMDDDDLRRGQPTVHRAFDDATAILAGDALLTLAFEGLARAGASPAAIVALGRQAGSLGMAGGQALDLSFERTRPTRELLEEMFRKKTGALIRAAVELPVFASDHLETDAHRALIDYAQAIGLAFQIVDDLLDVEGTTEQIGKPAGSDLEHEKATWPALFGIQAARETASALTRRAWQALNRLPGNTDGLRLLGERIIDRKA